MISSSSLCWTRRSIFNGLGEACSKDRLQIFLNIKNMFNRLDFYIFNCINSLNGSDKRLYIVSLS